MNSSGKVSRKGQFEETGQRTFQRRPQFALRCSLGTVIDLSAGGMRIVSRKALRGQVTVRLEGHGIDHDLKAKAVWSRRLGFRLFEVGLEFIGADTGRDLAEWISIWAEGLP